MLQHLPDPDRRRLQDRAQRLRLALRQVLYWPRYDSGSAGPPQPPA